VQISLQNTMLFYGCRFALLINVGYHDDTIKEYNTKFEYQTH